MVELNESTCISQKYVSLCCFMLWPLHPYGLKPLPLLFMSLIGFQYPYWIINLHMSYYFTLFQIMLSLNFLAVGFFLFFVTMQWISYHLAVIHAFFWVTAMFIRVFDVSILLSHASMLLDMLSLMNRFFSFLIVIHLRRMICLYLVFWTLD